MSRSLPRIARIAVVLVALVLANPLRSQETSTGALRGFVFDPENRSIPGVTIAIVNSATGNPRSALTDSEGRFAFELLPPGDYSARAEIKGMSPQLPRRVLRRSLVLYLADDAVHDVPVSPLH